MKSLKISKTTQLPPNKLVIPQQTHEGKDSPVLSFATKYCCPATYHPNVEATFFCHWVKPTQPADLIFLSRHY